MSDEKLLPKIGDKLIHNFRKREGCITAEVISVDAKRGNVTLKIGQEIYSSLSSAAQAISGHANNGWTYWGLKKQKPKKQKPKKQRAR
ncbi:DUF4357 domain-containing protein [Noviherbaspirillum humi]|uniref:DUF4357 domain-containing protein n=1 Tax=Noviherbaspirillum humi TaxID=1688639 RepID=UPI00116080BD|nr:DUF4357 domain-containing protein [Noviherbaspirillum humi]